MIVKELKWISESGREAELLITDGKHKCLAFCHPCTLKEGDYIAEPLLAFMSTNIMVAEDKAAAINQLERDHLKHYCIAKVIDASNSLVRIGNIFINIAEDLPNDCKDGDIIEFSCNRLDV